MNVQFFCPRWGSEGISWSDFTKRVKDAGYDGIEWGLAHTTTDRELEEAWNCAAKHGLGMIPQHYDTNDAHFQRHKDAYEAWLQRMSIYPAVKLNSQTGKDFFHFGQNWQLIQIGNKYGAVHETHRGKFSYAAHTTKTYLEEIPELRLTLDISHWVCVAESLLDDQPEAVNLAIERADHLHARLGHPEAPQVTDPREPEWLMVFERHLEWWDRVAARIQTEGKVLTITPEFGPYPYMVRLPVTGEPIADQWEVNRYMMGILRKRYG
ncbi:MAG: sugar phosphate isomerase/epimerase [Puia sp.]|nr:sugar phosphate isomerase/epimerase [Puia sp.]